MNYFAHQTAAERYAKSRPRFHSVIIDRMKTVCGVVFERALDVAYGPGLSSSSCEKNRKARTSHRQEHVPCLESLGNRRKRQ